MISTATIARRCKVVYFHHNTTQYGQSPLAVYRTGKRDVTQNTVKQKHTAYLENRLLGRPSVLFEVIARHRRAIVRESFLLPWSASGLSTEPDIIEDPA